MPKQSVIRVISVIQMAEQAVTDNEMEEHGRLIGELGNKKEASTFFYSAHEEGYAIFSFATNQVINRWTTFPLPSLQQWQEASVVDPDVAYLIECIKAKKRVVLQRLIC